MKTIRRLDPTRTLYLRKTFEGQFNKRFRALCGIVKKAIVAEDCFALKKESGGFAILAEMITRGREVFNFPRSQDKVTAFMDWLQTQEQAGILEITKITQIGLPAEAAWTDMYIQDSYKRGVLRAKYELMKAGYDIPAIAEAGGIMATLNTPIHLDRLGLLYTRTFSGLKGITSAMDNQLSQILAQGIADGDNPVLLARKLTRTITGPVGDLGLSDTLGRFIPAKRRARMLARTEIIRAHAQASLIEMKSWGAEDVTAEVEFVTAGYNVCPICADLEGQIFSIDDAMNIIPVHPNCFLDRQTPVYTPKGWNPIGDIQIGDYALTHKGRFKKVYALPQSKGYKDVTEVVRFWIRGMGQGGLSMTANHPVLITEEGLQFSYWKEARHVKSSDQIRLLAGRCKRCDILIPYFRDYCSQSCLSKDITDRQWADPAHRENMSKKARAQMKREYASGERDASTITIAANKKSKQLAKEGRWVLQRPEVREIIRQVTNTPEMRKESSERMKKNNPMHDPVTRQKARLSLEDYLEKHPEKRLNARMAKHRKSGKKTWIEERMAALLDKIGIDYIFQYPILRYNVDFAIPELRIAIECDGENWHQDKQKDDMRQKKIEQEGWFVLRYAGKKINQCLEEIETELSRVLMNHSGDYEFISFPIQKIERWLLRKNRTLYNLSVDEDESYCAKGIIVHNCRCAWIPKI